MEYHRIPTSLGKRKDFADAPSKRSLNTEEYNQKNALSTFVHGVNY